MTRRQRDARNARVARGLSWAVIEERHGISERQCRRIADAYVARRPPIEFDPDAVVAELLAKFEQAIEDLALLSTDADSDAVKLGAITRRLELVERRIVVLRSLGLLPRDWGRWVEGQMDRALFRRVMERLETRADVPNDVVHELWAELCDEHPRPDDPDPAARGGRMIETFTPLRMRGAARRVRGDGRYVVPEYEEHAARLAALPRRFRWDTCAVP